MYVAKHTVFTWLNAITFIYLSAKYSYVATSQTWPLIENDIWTHKFKIHCNTNQVWWPFKVQHSTN